MENIYSIMDQEKRRIERETICFEQEQASDNLTFIFSSKPKITIIKKEMSSFLEGFRR